MRQFYLYKNSSGYYNAIFVDPTSGKRGIDKSTHSKDKIEATMIATSWLKEGIPQARPNARKYSASESKIKLNLKSIAENITQEEAQSLMNILLQKFNLSVPEHVRAIQTKDLNLPAQVQKTQKNATSKPQKAGIPLSSFLLNFWDFDNSEFIKRYIAHGHNMTKRHTQMMLGLVKNYWKPENKKIESNPMAGIERFNAEELARGIPTESEVKKMLQVEWLNDTYKLAFKLGIYCGLRAGEISGLRVCDLDLDADLIHVNHSWNDTDGLKKPKNSDKRYLPIDHQTLEELYAMAKKNPKFSDLSYVFFSPVKPELQSFPCFFRQYILAKNSLWTLILQFPRCMVME